MSFRLMSKSGDALALALKIHSEGSDVDVWLKRPSARPGYKGLLPQVDDWRTGLKKDTIVFFDMVGMGSIAERLMRSGHIVYGGGKLNDAMELNREMGMQIAKISGVKVPKWKKFHSFDVGDFLTEGRWVFKPDNNLSPGYTYVSSDKADMVEMLDYFKGVWTGKIDFILQEYIEGIEISTEGFYRDGKIIDGTLNSTIELKKFMDGDVGPNTGCQGSVVWFWKKADPKIYRLGLRKIEPFLRRFKYSGPLDLNCIISEKDGLPYFLEFTTRFGYSAIYAASEGLNVGVGDFIKSIALGSSGDSQTPLRPSHDWLGAVRVSVPPYPHEVSAVKSADKPIRGVDGLEHIWLLDAKYQNGDLVTAGVDGVVCEVTGRNKTLNGLEKDIYGRIGKLKIPDMQYRSDIVSSAIKTINQLKERKYF